MAQTIDTANVANSIVLRFVRSHPRKVDSVMDVYVLSVSIAEIAQKGHTEPFLGIHQRAGIRNTHALVLSLPGSTGKASP